MNPAQYVTTFLFSSGWFRHGQLSKQCFANEMRFRWWDGPIPV